MMARTKAQRIQAADQRAEMLLREFIESEPAVRGATLLWTTAGRGSHTRWAQGPSSDAEVYGMCEDRLGAMEHQDDRRDAEDDDE